MILGYSIQQILWYFLIYSFLGWCLEVVYCTVGSGKPVNRGFLNGPVCPVYGFGMLLILLVARIAGYSDISQVNSIVLFLAGSVLASSVELFAGWILLKAFHMRWWDYSQRPFNIGGYICLQYSLMWGIAIEAAVHIVHTSVSHLVEGYFTSKAWTVFFLIGLLAILLADFIVTILFLIGLNKKLEELNAIRDKMRIVSDELSTKIGISALETETNFDERRIQAALLKAEAKDAAEDASKTLRKRVFDLESHAEEVSEKLLHHPIFGFRRLLSAFPQLRHEHYAEVIDKLRLYQIRK